MFISRGYGHHRVHCILLSLGIWTRSSEDQTLSFLCRARGFNSFPHPHNVRICCLQMEKNMYTLEIIRESCISNTVELHEGAGCAVRRRPVQPQHSFQSKSLAKRLSCRTQEYEFGITEPQSEPPALSNVRFRLLITAQSLR